MKIRLILLWTKIYEIHRVKTIVNNKKIFNERLKNLRFHSTIFRPRKWMIWIKWKIAHKKASFLSFLILYNPKLNLFSKIQQMKPPKKFAFLVTSRIFWKKNRFQKKGAGGGIFFQEYRVAKTFLNKSVHFQKKSVQSV